MSVAQARPTDLIKKGRKSPSLLGLGLGLLIMETTRYSVPRGWMPWMFGEAERRQRWHLAQGHMSGFFFRPFCQKECR